MYTERLSAWQMATRPEGRVAVAGTVLAILQSVGFIISLYLLVSSYQHNQDDPYQHVCVEAVLCLMYRYGPEVEQTGQTDTALAGQMVFSLLAITVNCVLVCAALSHNPSAFLPWLVLYGIITFGSLVLSVIVTLTILFRDNYRGDVDLADIVWFLLPLSIFILYTILWCIIFSVYRKLASYKNDIYYVRT